MSSLKQAMAKSLSSDDILKLCEGKVKIMLYPDLVKYDDIYKAMGKHKAIALLYVTNNKNNGSYYGHWCAVFLRDQLAKNGKPIIEFFDPYSVMPDGERSWISKEALVKNNQVLPHLARLLLKSGAEIEYNHKKLQKKDKDIATCGRWTASRIFLRKWPLQKFIDYFTSSKKYSPDQLVTLSTRNV